MLDLTTIDNDTLIARGSFSTVNSALKDEYRRIQLLTGDLSSASSRILRQMQPDNNGVPESVEVLFAAARETLDAIEICVARIVELAQQKQDLRFPAWGRK